MNDLAAVATAVAEQSGIRLPLDRLADAIEGIAREETGVGSGAHAGTLIRRLIDALTVKESYFLRQPDDLRALEWPLLLAQATAAGRHQVRVWSAACAHGEEPYTLAMMAAEAFPADGPPVDVLGTDISASAIEGAAAGVYGGRAVRRVATPAIERFFEPTATGLAVREPLRRLVRFTLHNLARDPYPPSGEQRFDVIVCRNVLIYFEPFAIEHFARSVPGALYPGGKLVLGAADRLCLNLGSLRDLGGLLGTRPPVRARGGGRTVEPSRAPPAARERPPVEPRPARAVTDPTVAGALRLADEGRLDDASRVVRAVVEGDPMNAPAQFVQGTLALAAGDPASAVPSLRAALYADPDFAAAAFQLGRAHDALDQADAARRSYWLALERLQAGPSPYPWLLDDVDAADLAVACAIRLKGH